MEHTIAAISTATGEAGIGIVRLSGKDSIEIGKKIFRPMNNLKIDEIENKKMKYGHIYDGETLIDEVLIVFMKGPNTYTREDIVEIYTHGGVISVKKVLNTALKNGATLAENGEFTKRAFLNGRLDLSQAEAVIDMIKAKTDKAYEVSISQLEGSLKNEIKKYRDGLLNLLAHVEYSINFTEDGQEELDNSVIIKDGEEILKSLKKLYNSSNKGKIIRDGINTTIIGKPNVGKSSLLNKLAKVNKAIVTDIPGTTRDVIEEYIDIDGIALKINDTAGIRDTEDVVEKIGVDKSLDFAQTADLIIAIFDLSKELDEEDKTVLDLLKDRKSIVLLNKSDLENKLDLNSLKIDENIPVIEISIKNNIGIETLENTISEMFVKGDIVSSNETLVTNIRHQNILERAIEHLEYSVNDMKTGIPIDCLEVDLRDAWEILGEITGETIEDDVLDKIFKDFCIGK
ncbi:tRNA uridine-5-carboxymethylaminomethyl(34) synthesis GTPase MnmE [Miniphocaeibacter massiliensis]|uniref:tRNA uridine-5-carboxymethylaminomethyl(34) synthesis GTPase MnmE n=1 Tax=Miniphocaeibacter massiliensis TaxID=2041841 RepID=UPI000C1C4637|nr:tRNA uridine-5-carboxymethylaminomethyl(34) synthesis GTPase MnmE [Miniphocaeibacter massiliensis]